MISVKKCIKDIIWLLIIFPLVYPYCLNSLLPAKLRIILAVFVLLSFCIIVLLYIQKGKMDILNIVILVYCIILVFSTYINNGDKAYNVLVSGKNFSFAKVFGLTLLISYVIRKKNYNIIGLILSYYELIIFINLITIILFRPRGMYFSDVGAGHNYFLGLDNTHCNTYYLAIAMAFGRDFLDGKVINGKFSKNTVMLILIVNISVILCMSMTSVVQVVCFDFLLLFRNTSIIDKLLKPFSVVLLNFSISIFFLFFYTANDSFLSDIIINVFGKKPTLTGRVVIWKNALKEAVSRPILGHGLNLDYSIRTIQYSHTHNQYLTDFYFGGVILFILLISIVMITVYSSSLCKDRLSYLFLSLMFVSLFHWNFESYHLILQFGTFSFIYNFEMMRKGNKIQSYSFLETLELKQVSVR